jgi:hypothetical protein
MKPKNGYLLLCIVGIALPYWALIPWLFHPGATPGLFIRELFANRISTSFALDVIVSALVLFRFIRAEGGRIGVRHRWLPMLGTLCVGVSLGFPIFLYMREARMEELVATGTSTSP